MAMSTLRLPTDFVSSIEPKSPSGYQWDGKGCLEKRRCFTLWNGVVSSGWYHIMYLDSDRIGSRFVLVPSVVSASKVKLKERTSQSKSMATPTTNKGWLNSVSAIASRLFFFLIFFQIPLFRYLSVIRCCNHLLLPLFAKKYSALCSIVKLG